VRRGGRKAVSAAVSVALLVPVITLASMLILNAYIQSTLSQNAALNQAGLAAEEGKKYLRATALRGPSNQTLINLYGAGKLPITIDYLIVELQDGTVLVEKSGDILTVNPGENVTIAPSQLDPRLSPYDGDYWKAKREIGRLILHTGDGNTLYLSWGQWAGATAVTYSTNTATTWTTSTTTTTTITETATYLYVVRMASTRTVTSTIGAPRSTTSIPGWGGSYSVTASCTLSGSYYYSTIRGGYVWTGFNIDCTVTASGATPPYSVTGSYRLTAIYAPWPQPSTSGSIGSYTIPSSGGSVRIQRSISFDPGYQHVEFTVTIDVQESSSNRVTQTITKSCILVASGLGSGTASCNV